MGIRAVAVGALVLLSPVSAGAVDIAVCGGSHGYAYFPEIGILQDDPNTGKWVTDGISDGRITLATTAENELDILFGDASGGVYSAANEGARVILIDRSDDKLAVLAVYPQGAIETYTFYQSASGPEVLWSSNKFNALIPKMAAYRASCRFLYLE
ncbi:hypothetical protein [Bauldia litoralis]|uniref:hypothetical protein n=1 Tax=Bauldia litoralis TaxID=665467 RepID=UPI003265A45A